MELVIMNANKEKIGNVRLFLVPREVGRHGDYFDIMDAVNDVGPLNSFRLVEILVILTHFLSRYPGFVELCSCMRKREGLSS